MIECTSGWSRRYHDQVDPITTGVRPQRKVWGTQGGKAYKCHQILQKELYNSQKLSLRFVIWMLPLKHLLICNFPDQIIVLITFPLRCTILSDKCESSIWWLDLVPWNICLCKCPELYELLISFPLKNVNLNSMHQTYQMRFRLQMHTCKLQFLLLWQAMRWICQNNISSTKSANYTCIDSREDATFNTYNEPQQGFYKCHKNLSDINDFDIVPDFRKNIKLDFFRSWYHLERWF